MKCNSCGAEVPEDDTFVHQGETVCEDCYLEAVQRPKGCDPWAVYAATSSVRTSGGTGAEGLTELQRAIYGFVKSSGKVTLRELAERFSMPPRQLETQITILRHCELVKGSREDDRHYIVPFSV